MPPVKQILYIAPHLALSFYDIAAVVCMIELIEYSTATMVFQ